MRPKQQTLAASGFERYRKRMRREQFLADMNQVVPWDPLVERIAPVYPKGEGAGRPPVGLERMLRIHCLQHWFNLSDPAVEEALYDSRAMCEFVGIDLGREPVPDETTICKFRHLLEAHDLGPQILAAVNAHLAEQGFKVSTGTIVDATIISAPSSTKNRDSERDPEMHQTKKGNEWHFGMKAHIGVDSRHRLILWVANSQCDGTGALRAVLQVTEVMIRSARCEKSSSLPSTCWSRLPSSSAPAASAPSPPSPCCLSTSCSSVIAPGRPVRGTHRRDHRAEVSQSALRLRAHRPADHSDLRGRDRQGCRPARARQTLPAG